MTRPARGVGRSSIGNEDLGVCAFGTLEVPGIVTGSTSDIVVLSCPQERGWTEHFGQSRSDKLARARVAL